MADKKSERVSIEVPAVSGEEVGNAIDLVEDLLRKYGIDAVDADALFNGMVAIYLRQRAVYGDRQPTQCSFAVCVGAVKD